MLSREENSAARNFMLSSMVWLVIAAAAGLTASLYFFDPDRIRGIAVLGFGRLRPVHVNGVAFGWLSMAQIGAMLYMVPRLCRTKLYSERLGNLTMWLWNLTVAGGALALLLGYTEGKEYAELVAPFDYLILFLLILLAINVWGTILRRKERLMYVTLWYFGGTVLWFPLIYYIGNRTFVQLGGLNDAIAGWFYGHNTLGMWFTTAGVGATYYLLPLLARRPLYSHLLSLIGFWTIAIFYTPVGTHHILQAPVPEWLKAIASTSSAMLLVPVLTVLVNFFMTIRQSWDRVAYNTPLKYLVAGNIYYLLTCVQGPFQASRGINWYIHFTQWVVGHAHLALLGTFTFIQMSAIYYALPRILKRPIYSERLANVQFWLMVIGFSVMLAVLTIAGLIQGATWAAGVPVAFTGVLLRPYFFIRSLSGVALVFAFGLFAYNVLQTWREARAEVGSTTPSQHGSATPSQPAEERQIGLDPQANPPRDEAFWSPQAPAEYVKMAARAKSQAPKEHGAAEEPAFEPRFITNGRGIFLEKCAVCHGPEGKGDGPAGRHLVKRPANFWEPRFKTYSDAMWLWRVSEGVPGTNMPIWKLSLTEQQCWYLVIFLKYLAKQSPGEPPVDTFTTEEFIQDTEKVWQSLLPLDKSVFPKEKAEGETAAAQGPAKAQVGGETASTAQEPDGESETEKAAPERLRQEE